MEKLKLSTEDFYAFKLKNMWAYFLAQHFSFKMICCYLFVEFVRPQSIIPALDILPWALLFIALSAVGAVLDPTVKWVSSGANKLIAIFLFLIIGSIFFAQYPSISKAELHQFINWFMIYFLIINIVNTKERFYIFVLILLVSSAKIALGTSRSWVFRGFSFTSWGLTGPSGFFQNSGELTILMLILFPLAFYMYQSLKMRVSKWERWFLIMCWVCPILTILGASSRGSQVALVVQLVIMFRKSIFKVKPLIGVIVLCTAFFYLLPQEQKDRFTAAGEDKSSLQRLLYWEHGWEMMKEHPFVGVGYFNFIPYYEEYYPSDMLYANAQLPHNIFIQVGTDAGFPALIIFIFINIYAIGVSWRTSTNKNLDPVLCAIGAGLGMGVVGFLVAGQFVTVTYYPFLWINLSFIVALRSIARNHEF